MPMLAAVFPPLLPSFSKWQCFQQYFLLFLNFVLNGNSFWQHYSSFFSSHIKPVIPDCFLAAILL
jgi:hypothetical protein